MKSIMIRLLLIIVLPPTLIYVAFTKSDYEIPYDDYHVKDQDVIINDEMNRILLKQTSGTENIKISQSAFNNLIFNNLRETENAFYDPSPTCDNPLCDFIIIIDHPEDDQNAKVGIRGIWGVFEEEELTLFIAFKANYIIPINTVITMRFDVINNQEQLTLTFSGSRLGKTPIPKFVLNMIINSAFKAVGEETHASYGDALVVDASNLSFSLNKGVAAESVTTYPQIQQIFLDESTPYSIWIFIIWKALDL